MKGTRIAAVSTALVLSALMARGADLKSHRATYEKELETIVLSHGMQMTELHQEYIKALDSLLAKVKASGDLDRTTAVMQEIDRFRKDKQMPEKLSSVLDVQQLQTAYAKQASSREIEKTQRLVRLSSGYDQALERLQRTLVSSSKLDDAKEVQNERKRVSASDVIQDAKRVVKRASSPPKNGGPDRPALPQSKAEETVTPSMPQTSVPSMAMLLNRSFEYRNLKIGKTLGVIILGEDGSMSGFKGKNENSWVVDDAGVLSLLDIQGKPSCVFDRHESKKGKLIFQGRFKNGTAFELREQ